MTFDSQKKNAGKPTDTSCFCTLWLHIFLLSQQLLWHWEGTNHSSQPQQFQKKQFTQQLKGAAKVWSDCFLRCRLTVFESHQKLCTFLLGSYIDADMLRKSISASPSLSICYFTSTLQSIQTQTFLSAVVTSVFMSLNNLLYLFVQHTSVSFI